MRRYALDIEYDGTDYVGWQVQPNGTTVQALLNEALSTVLRQEIYSIGAGRTDAGVHATQLIVHFDGPDELPINFDLAVNGILPPDIAVKKVLIPQKKDFHARFDATHRAYIYQMTRRKSVHHRKQALWLRHGIDLNLMSEAAKMLLDFSEFGAFCKSQGSNKTNTCYLQHAYFEEKGDLLRFHIRADRFLRGMVRAIVGTLLLVGKGAMTPEEFREVIVSQDRKKAGTNVDARGLFLVEVGYAEGMFSDWKKS